jgi:hypothetical protein
MRQRRWTVLLRVILALPLGVAVLAVGIAVFLSTVIGWFAALVTGRAPRFLRTAVTVFLQLTARFEAYRFFLTDRFPPFSGGDVPAYPIGVEVPPGTRLNRASVLFRLVLVVPANIALNLVGLGLNVLAFFMWMAVFITGWLPRPFHEAIGAFIRFEIRVWGYLALLVPTYPRRLFGDEWTEMWAVWGPDASEQNTNPSVPPSLLERDWKLVLGRGAKRVLVLAVIFGVAAFIGLQVLNLRAQNHENLVQDNNQLVSSLNAFASSVNQCGSVACLEHVNGELSQQLGSFVGAIEGSDNAGVSQNLVDRLTTAAENTEHATQVLSSAGPSLAEYRTTAARVHVTQSLDALISAQHHFVTALNGSF